MKRNGEDQDQAVQQFAILFDLSERSAPVHSVHVEHVQNGHGTVRSTGIDSFVGDYLSCHCENNSFV